MYYLKTVFIEKIFFSNNYIQIKVLFDILFYFLDQINF